MYDSIREKFDPNKSIEEQVAGFTREEFITFINYPKYVKEGQLIEIKK